MSYTNELRDNENIVAYTNAHIVIFGGNLLC